MKSISEFLKENKNFKYNSNEFRLVIKNLNSIKYSKEGVLDFTDFYISRNIRLRKTSKKYGSKIYLIEAIPGTIKKKKTEINETKFNSILKDNPIILEIIKKGIGETKYNNIKNGYVENVIAKKQNKILFDEIHIEFESIRNQKELYKIVEIIKPIKIIQIGLFDYCNKK